MPRIPEEEIDRLKRETDLAALVEDIADGYRRRTADTGVKVEVESTGSAELMIDPVRIREVLTNLADNARRAMPDGGRLGFGVSATGSEASIVVSDTGTGIAPEDLEQVFDRFHKGSTSRGSGLGLTISRDGRYLYCGGGDQQTYRRIDVERLRVSSLWRLETGLVGLYTWREINQRQDIGPNPMSHCEAPDGTFFLGSDLPGLWQFTPEREP